MSFNSAAPPLLMIPLAKVIEPCAHQTTSPNGEAFHVLVTIACVQGVVSGGGTSPKVSS